MIDKTTKTVCNQQCYRPRLSPHYEQHYQLYKNHRACHILEIGIGPEELLDLWILFKNNFSTWCMRLICVDPFEVCAWYFSPHFWSHTGLCNFLILLPECYDLYWKIISISIFSKINKLMFWEKNVFNRTQQNSSTTDVHDSLILDTYNSFKIFSSRFDCVSVVGKNGFDSEKQFYLFYKFGKNQIRLYFWRHLHIHLFVKGVALSGQINRFTSKLNLHKQTSKQENNRALKQNAVDRPLEG